MGPKRDDGCCDVTCSRVAQCSDLSGDPSSPRVPSRNVRAWRPYLGMSGCRQELRLQRHRHLHDTMSCNCPFPWILGANETWHISVVTLRFSWPCTSTATTVNASGFRITIDTRLFDTAVAEAFLAFPCLNLRENEHVSASQALCQSFGMCMWTQLFTNC